MSSFWGGWSGLGNEIGDIGGTLQGLGGTIAHGLGAAIELTGVNLEDPGGGPGQWDQMLSSFGKLMGNASASLGPVGYGIGEVMQADNWAYSNIISHPLTTAWEAATLTGEKSWVQGGQTVQVPTVGANGQLTYVSKTIKAHGIGGWNNSFSAMFDPNTWSTAWDIAKHKSPGQAVMDTVVGTAKGLSQGGHPDGVGDVNTSASNKDLVALLTSPQARALAEEHDPNAAGDYDRQWWYSLTSGALDAGTGMALDPMAMAARWARPAMKVTVPLAKTITKMGDSRFIDAGGMHLFNVTAEDFGPPQFSPDKTQLQGVRGKPIKVGSDAYLLSDLSDVGSTGDLTRPAGVKTAPSQVIQSHVEDTPWQRTFSWVEQMNDQYGTNSWRVLAQHPVLRDTPQGANIAILLSQAETQGEMATIVRAGMGDGKTYLQLNQTQSDITAKIRRLQDANDSISKTYAMYMRGTSNYVLDPMEIATDQERLKVNELEIANLEHRAAWIDKLIGPTSDEARQAVGNRVLGGSVVNPSGAKTYTLPQQGTIESASAEGTPQGNPGIFGSMTTTLRGDRSAKLLTYQAQWSKAIQDSSQRGMRYLPQAWHSYDGFSTPVRVLGLGLGKANHFLNDVKPQGWLDVNAPDGWRELDWMLRRVKGMDPKKRNELVAAYVSADGEEGRLHAAQNAEREGLTAALANAGVTDVGPETVNDLMARHLSARATGMGMLRDRAYAATTNPSTGRRIDLIMEDDGATTITPLLAEQLANKVPLIDMDAAQRAIYRHKYGLMAKYGSPVRDLAIDTGDMLMRLWKTSALMRLGYIVRTVSDDSLAMQAKLGAMVGLHNLAEGAGTFAYNKAWTAKNILDTFQARHALIQSGDETVFNGLQSRYLGPLNAALSGMDYVGRAFKVDRNEWESIPKDLKAGSPKKTMLRDQDVIDHPVAGKIKLGPFSPESRIGDYWRGKLHPDDRMHMEMDANYRLAQARRFMAHSLVNRDDVNFKDAWHSVLNQQFANSPLVKRLIQARGSDSTRIDTVSKWLTDTTEGRSYMRRVPMWSGDPKDWVGRVHLLLNDYADAGIPDLRESILTGHVKRELLDSPEAEELAPDQVHGAITGYNMGDPKNALIRMTQNVRDGWFRMAHQMPVDNLVRHPLARTMYFRRLNESVKAAADSGGIIDSQMLTKLENQARHHALNEINKVVLDLTRYSNAAHVMRFIAPFYGAWDLALKRWGKIGYSDPGIIFKGNRMWQGVSNAPIFLGDAFGNQTQIGKDVNGNPVYAKNGIYDQNGNPVGVNTKNVNPLTGLGDLENTFLTFRMPSWAAKLLGAEEFNQVQIPESALNVTVSGNPWWLPGMGPVVQLPLAAVLKNRPDVAKNAAVLLPYTTNSALEQLAPGWLGKFLAVNDPLSVESTSLAIQGYQIDLAKWQANGGAKSKVPPPSPTDPKYQDQAVRIQALGALTQMVSPVNMHYQTPYKFYMDQYHRMASTPQVDQQMPYKLDASGQPLVGSNGKPIPNYVDPSMAFQQKYPAYWIFTESMSKNNGAIPATDSAYAISQKFNQLLAQNPMAMGTLLAPYGNAVSWDAKSRTWVPNKTANGFDYAVYAAQFNTDIPGTSTTERQRQTVSEFATQAQADQGWRIYKQGMDQLRIVLAQRGLASFNQTGAQDLKFYKSEITYRLGLMYPAFKQQMDSYDTNHNNELVGQLTNMLDDPRIQKMMTGESPARPDLVALRQYVYIRDQIMATLYQRGTSGGSATITANGNGDLLQSWTQARDVIAMDNPLFSEWIYDRYLANDTNLVATVPPKQTTSTGSKTRGSSLGVHPHG